MNYKTAKNKTAKIETASIEMPVNLEIPNVLRSLPTLSGRKRIALSILNDILKEHPEYKNAIYALTVYSTQKWANDTRRYMIGETYIPEEMEDDVDAVFAQLDFLINYTGIRPCVKLADWSECLMETDFIVNIIEEGVNWLESLPKSGDKLANVIRSVHFMPFSTAGNNKKKEVYKDVSPIMMHNYYRIAVIELCERYYYYFDEIINRIKKHEEVNPEQYKKAYHNTKTLIGIYQYVEHFYTKNIAWADNWSPQRIQKSANGLHLLSAISFALSCIKTYPNNGEILYKVLTLAAEGCNDAIIATALGINRKTAYALREKATNLLSFVLWGYSSKQMIEGFLS